MYRLTYSLYPPRGSCHKGCKPQNLTGIELTGSTKAEIIHITFIKIHQIIGELLWWHENGARSMKTMLGAWQKTKKTHSSEVPRSCRICLPKTPCACRTRAFPYHISSLVAVVFSENTARLSEKISRVCVWVISHMTPVLLTLHTWFTMRYQAMYGKARRGNQSGQWKFVVRVYATLLLYPNLFFFLLLLQNGRTYILWTLKWCSMNY